jgi:hypothetical protein
MASIDGDHKTVHEDVTDAVWGLVKLHGNLLCKTKNPRFLGENRVFLMVD